MALPLPRRDHQATRSLPHGSSCFSATPYATPLPATITHRPRQPPTLQAPCDKTKDSIYGSLPSIEGINSPQIQSYSPPLLAELNDAHDIRDITPFPTSDLNKPPSQPSSYTTPHGGSPELFWIPKRFSVTETLGLAAQIFRNNEINYITPPGELIGDTYVWHANTALEPDFKVSNEDALANESNAAFLSGIFFGIAGAALIALIQEVPKESYRRISRRSHS